MKEAQSHAGTLELDDDGDGILEEDEFHYYDPNTGELAMI